jgi:hypothetical protein
LKKILIIGQGIAGTVLAWQLRQLGADVWVMDAPAETPSASSVAAGIVNPVTGKRFAKSWMFEEMFPYARACYQQMEQQFGVQIWQDLSIERMLQHPEELNNWSLRTHAPEYAHFVSPPLSNGVWQTFTHAGYEFGVIHQAARVHFETLISVFRQKLQAEDRLIEARFDFNSLDQMSADYDFLLFCEGHRGSKNPLFHHLPWNVTKGEALHIRLNSNQLKPKNEILKKTVLLAPYQGEIYWTGSTNEWKFDDPAPSVAGREWLEKELRAMLDVPFTIEAHKAAIRPTVKDRRPLIGMHPAFPKIGIFNGLGTKGGLLAPYWAQHFAQHVLHGLLLDPQVDIRRV